ncbi:T9SS type A sorting domain-containing protein [Leptobacterium flavescens]|uniref:T9SS type A sorting domain-containing protein n=1 Tax=Leptobacterium flavescens TaxID=472055 RepID=A0A6P0UKR9_9FLAO|nr:fibronectin type III domain-containing protein [Leptobacterium flavescens]NER13142.1 T9SS type A sorting domain-containing protein [Leptobacterium flavescens]
MKRRLLRPILLGLSLVILSTFVLISLKKGKADKGIDMEEVISQRKQHAEHLKNSPFKETLQLTKAERKAKGLPPNKYFEQMWELTMNPNTGRTEPEKLFEVQGKLIESRKRISNRAPGDAADNPWSERGPNDIGGRTRVMLFDPNDANNRRVYAGGVSGGLWVNNDITSASSTWSRVQNVPGNLSVTSITVDPRNSNTWYVGTGEQYTAGDVVGNGVYRTTDGGNSWTAVNIPAAGGGNINFNASNLFLSGIYYVNDVIAWDNGSSTELFVAVGAHVYGDSSNPTNWLGLQSAGLYRSTDGGSTWNRIQGANLEFDFQGTPYPIIPNDLEIGPDNKLWMGTITTPGLGGGGGGRVFSSTNGSTWTEAAASPLADSNRVELEVSASNANKIYALTQGVSSPVHIYSTTNGFATAPATLALPNDADNGISANDFTRGQAFYDLMIEADPNNDNIVYVGGIDLFRSTNSGSSWTQISKWSNNPGLNTLNVPLVHADQHAMTFRPGNSNQAVFGNDGGIYYASSLSASQNSSTSIGARNSNYNVTQYVKAAIGPDGPGDTSGIFTAGAQDNGSQAFRNTTPGINGSEELSDGDGFYTFVDKDGQYMIATFVRNVIYRFDLPWNGLGRRQGGATTLSNDQTRGDFVNQMDYDSDANRLLTNNSNNTQNAIKSINVAANSNGSITNAALTARPTAFRASPFANNEWLVGMANGGLLRLTNVTNTNATFATITTPFVGSVSSVRYGATANDIMVTIHNYGVASVWYSSDAGANWSNKEGNLPDIPVRDILQNPLDLNEAILGTQLGVWVTTNFNATNPTWTQAYNGMSDASVTSFDYWNVSGDNTDNRIIASTYGRGVFTGSFTPNGSTVDLEAPTAPTNLAAANVTQTTVDLSWTASTDNVGVTEYDVYQGGAVIATVAGTTHQVTGLTANTAYTFTVRAKDAAGNESADSNAVNVTTQNSTPGVCTGDVTSFPYAEGFESGFGGWTQDSGDDFDWTRQSGGTPSNSTGPSGAVEGSFYVYVETSVPNNPNLTATLNSPCFDLSGESQATYTFRYHMTGNAVGVLRLEASTDNGGTWTEIWSQTGDQGANWNDASVNMNAYAGGTVRLRYRGTSGSSWQGDMAVDDINLSVGALPDTEAPTAPANLTASNITDTTIDLSWDAATDNVGVTEYDVYQGASVIATVTGTTHQVTGLTAGTAYTFTVRAKDAAGNESADSNAVNASTTGGSVTGCTGGISTFPYNEGFESGFGGWTQDSGDDFDWTRNSGGTPSNSTGPSSAFEGSFYMYVETSAPNNPNLTATLNSPCFNLSSAASASFTFRYHMTGNAVGNLRLEASNDNGATWTEVWSRSGDQGANWNNAVVNLNAYAGNSVQLRYVGTSGSSWQGDMAVDNIALTTGTGGGNTGCSGGITSFPYNESFEGGFGAWTQASGDDFDWTRQSGGTPSTGTGPTSAFNGTFYVYVETSSPNNPNLTATLNSPCFDLSGASSATFDFNYHMTGNAVGVLRLEASNDDGATWTEVWSRSGDQGANWNAASVDLGAYTGNSVQLRYVGTSGSSWQGDLVVDNISLSTTNTTRANDDLINLSGNGQNTDGILDISFYPNPVTGNVLNIVTTTRSAMNYRIMNITGQVVSRGKVNNNSVNVQNLSDGAYIIEVETENNERAVKRFIKQ